MRAESAVEPTKSENITVTWRRSARSSGTPLGCWTWSLRQRKASRRPRRRAEQRWHPTASHGVQTTRRRVPSGSHASGSGEPSRLCHSRGDRLVLPEAQTPQPDHDVHDGAPLLRVAAHHGPAPKGCLAGARRNPHTFSRGSPTVRLDGGARSADVSAVSARRPSERHQPRILMGLANWSLTELLCDQSSIRGRGNVKQNRPAAGGQNRS